MSSNTWILGTVAVLACGGGRSPAGEPAQWPVTGTTRAGPAAASSCQGLAPQQLVPIEVAGCSGVTAGASGPTGTFAGAATADATGSLALGCQNAQTGRDVFFVFLPFSGNYRRIAPLSERAVPMQSGFYSTSQSQRGPSFLFDRAGRPLASLGESHAFASAAGTVEVISLSGGTLLAQQYDVGAVPHGGAVRLADAGQGQLVVGGAANAAGRTLVVWGTGDRVQGRWLGADGQPETPAFLLGGRADQIGDSAALPDGSVAIGGANGPRWRSVVAQGATTESAAPGWLASRGAFAVVRGGKALLFGQELVAADGTSCGSIDFGSAPAGVGLDGTVVTVADEKTFRVYPQLLR